MPAANDSGEKEAIRSRLIKVLRLAQQGVGGERENAEELLTKLLRKHSMSLADLEGATDQARATWWLAVRDAEETIVLSQLSVRLFGLERKVYHRANGGELGIDVSPSEQSALIIAWDVYSAAFAQARRDLVMGFCYKHGLFESTGSGAAELDAEARANAARAIALAEVLPTVDGPARRIGGPRND